MNDQQLLLSSIIGNQITKCYATQKVDADLCSVLDEAKKQSVFPIAFAYLKESLKDAGLYESLNIENVQYTAQNINNLHAHAELHKMLSSHNIEYTILKGQASARYYPDPLLRTMGDVDFIVREKDIEAVDEILRKNGFKKLENAERHEYHWAYKKGKDSVELHWSIPGLPVNDDTVKTYLSEIIKKSHLVAVKDGEFFVPSDFHHGLVLLLHTISHMTGTGVGLRHLCDWLTFQNSMQEATFTSLFQKPLKEIGLWKFAQVLTRIGELYFGCPVRAWCAEADEHVCNAFLEDLYRGGNFGVKDGTRKSQAKLIQNQQSKKVEKGHIWKNGMISITEKTKKDFPIMWKTVIFRPIGCFFVCVQYLFRVAIGKRNNVFNQEIYRDAANRQTLYSELKLFER